MADRTPGRRGWFRRQRYALQASAKDQLRPLRANLCLGSCFVLTQGNASLQAGSPALQPGSAKTAPPGFHSGQPAFAALKLAPPNPRSPGETYYKVAKTLGNPFRQNRSRAHPKIWCKRSRLAACLSFRPGGSALRPPLQASRNPSAF